MKGALPGVGTPEAVIPALPAAERQKSGDHVERSHQRNQGNVITRESGERSKDE